MEYYFSSLNIKEKFENKYGIAVSMDNIGRVYGALGDYKNALEFLLKAYGINGEIGNRQGEMASFENIGDIYFKQKEYDTSLDYYMKGLKISEELGEHYMRVELLRGIGSVYQKLGKNKSAFKHYLKGLKISREAGDKENEQSVLINLGKLYGQTGKTAEGLQLLQQSLEIAEELKSKSMISESYQALSEACQQQGDYPKALEHYQKHHQYEKRIFNESSDKKRQAMMIRFQVEQKEKEAEIYRLKNEALLENMLDGVYRSTADGKFVEINPAMVRIFGYSSPKELLAVDIPNDLYLSPEDRGRAHPSDVDEHLAVFRLKRKDGSEIWVEDHCRFVRDQQGRIVFHEGVLRDITERRRAEEKLRESEEQYRKLVEKSPDGICIHSGGKVTYVNPAGVNLLGARDASQLIGKPFINFVHTDYKESNAKLDRRELKKRSGIRPIEQKFVRLDGTLVDVDVTTISIPYQDRSAVQVVFRDITERKRDEEKIQREKRPRSTA